MQQQQYSLMARSIRRMTVFPSRPSPQQQEQAPTTTTPQQQPKRKAPLLLGRESKSKGKSAAANANAATPGSASWMEAVMMDLHRVLQVHPETPEEEKMNALVQALMELQGEYRNKYNECEALRSQVQTLTQTVAEKDQLLYETTCQVESMHLRLQAVTYLDDEDNKKHHDKDNDDNHVWELEHNHIKTTATGAGGEASRRLQPPPASPKMTPPTLAIVALEEDDWDMTEGIPMPPHLEIPIPPFASEHEDGNTALTQHSSAANHNNSTEPQQPQSHPRFSINNHNNCNSPRTPRAASSPRRTLSDTPLPLPPTPISPIPPPRSPPHSCRRHRSTSLHSIRRSKSAAAVIAAANARRSLSFHFGDGDDQVVDDGDENYQNVDFDDKDPFASCAPLLLARRGTGLSRTSSPTSVIHLHAPPRSPRPLPGEDGRTIEI